MANRPAKPYIEGVPVIGKSLLKRLATIFLLLMCALLGAYLALPLWLPSLVRAQLAQGWQLESLEFDYPVSYTLHLDGIVLSGRPDGIGVRVAARNVDINFHQLSVDAAAMDVDVAFSDPGRKVETFALDDLTVPLIFRPGKLPRISVDSFRLNLQSGTMAGRSLLFTKLQLETNDTAQSWLKTSLTLLGISDLTGQLEIRVLHDALEAQLQLYRLDHGKVLQIDFRQSVENNSLSSEVLGQGHLQDLQPLLLAVFPGMSSPLLGQLKSIQGQVSFEGHFTGSDEQILDNARITARNVMIDMDNASLG
ncbi:MAG: hypothetical protein ACE1Y4_18935, partial [Lysobacterales bacterium]